MTIYYITMVLWLFIFFIFKESSLNKLKISNQVIESSKMRNIGVFLCGMILFFIMALKPEIVGTDTIAYKGDYEQILKTIHNFQFDLKSEYGFKLLMFGMSRMGISFRGFLIFYSAFIAWVISRFINKYCANYFLGFYLHMTIGFFAMSMTGIRQSLAVAFILLSFDFIKSKKKLLYFLCWIIAVSIHYTAVVCLPIGIISFFKFKSKKQLIFWGIIPIIVRISQNIIYLILLKYSPKKYFNNGYFDMKLNINIITELFIIGMFLVCLICFLQGKKHISNRDFQFYILSSFYVCCYELSYVLFMAARLSFYFNLFIIILLSNGIYRLKNQMIRLIAKIFLIIFSLLYFGISIPGSSYGISNYIFI